jgi:hypothetical protein
MIFLIGQVEEAKRLVMSFHYSRRFPANIQFIGSWHNNGGLFGDQGNAVGTAIFSIPPTRWKEEVLELSRLVRDDNVEVNLSGLISKCCKEIKKSRRFDLVVSFADFTQGHHGGIYQSCSWNFAGKRGKRMDGLIINNKFFPGRTCNSVWGTRSPNRIKDVLRTHTIEPHFDEGKYLYWKAINRNGLKKAELLGLKSLPYPKPTRQSLSA